MQGTSCSASFRGVLLAVAEVRIPLKQLTVKERCRVTHICYQKLLGIEVEDATPEERNLRCFGVIDSFYALQEMLITVDKDTCRLSNKAEAVLELELNHLTIATPARDSPDRLIIVSRTQNFGRTAVILQLHNENVAKQILKHCLNSQSIKRYGGSTEETGSSTKKGAGSLGRAMGRKVTNMFSALSVSLGSEKFQNVNKICPPSLQLDSDDEDDQSDAVPDDTVDTVDQNYPLVCFPTEQPEIRLLRTTMNNSEAEITYLKTSEKNFVEGLKYLEAVKKNLCTDSLTFIKLDHVMEIFLHIDILLMLHTDILTDLENEENTVIGIARVFEKFANKFEFYIDFIGHALAVDYLLKINSEFFQVYHPKLAGYLRTPRMRLNHYVQSLESLQRYSNESEQQQLKKQIDKLQSYLKQANTKLVAATIHNYPFDLKSVGNIILDGELLVKKWRDLPRRKYRVFLFEDMLVLAKGSPEYCEFVSSYPTKNLRILFELRGVLIHLKVTTEDKPFRIILKSRSINLQQKWLKALRSQIDLVSSKERKEMNKVDPSVQITSSSDSMIDKNISTDNQDRTQNFTEEVASHCLPPEDEVAEHRLPPLTILSAFPNFPIASLCEHNTQCFLKILLESEKSVVQNLCSLLCSDSVVNRTEAFAGLHSELLDLYHLHKDYLLPVVSGMDRTLKEEVICMKVASKIETFQQLYEKVLFVAAVYNYEFEDNQLCDSFRCIANQFLVYTKIFQSMYQMLGIQICRRVVAMLNDVAQRVAISLKRKYIQKFPTYLDFVFHEGPLQQQLPDIEANLYLILTESQLLFVGTRDNSYFHSKSFQPRNLTCCSCGRRVFEIKFHVSDTDKIKYRFVASSEVIRKAWVEAFRNFAENFNNLK